MFPARWTIRTQPRKACAPVESDIVSLGVLSSPTVNIVPEPRCSSRLCESGRMNRPGVFASLIQSSFGSPHGDFEAVVRLPSGDLWHYWRDNNNDSQAWGPAQLICSGAAYAGSLIQSHFPGRIAAGRPSTGTWPLTSSAPGRSPQTSSPRSDDAVCHAKVADCC
jgi:hypothetical protein